MMLSILIYFIALPNNIQTDRQISKSEQLKTFPKMSHDDTALLSAFSRMLLAEIKTRKIVIYPPHNKMALNPISFPAWRVQYNVKTLQLGEYGSRKPFPN